MILELLLDDNSIIIYTVGSQAVTENPYYLLNKITTGYIKGTSQLLTGRCIKILNFL